MLSPVSASAWDQDAAAHLTLRAGFGPRSRQELKILAGLGPERAVETFARELMELFTLVELLPWEKGIIPNRTSGKPRALSPDTASTRPTKLFSSSPASLTMVRRRFL